MSIGFYADVVSATREYYYLHVLRTTITLQKEGIEMKRRGVVVLFMKAVYGYIALVFRLEFVSLSCVELVSHTG